MKKIIILMMIFLVGLTACTENVFDTYETPCTREYMPLCCDGIIYPNQCYADNAQAENCVEGQCPEEDCVPDNKICPDNLDPYCCDNTQYNNYCEAMNNCATNCIKGECNILELEEECEPLEGVACTMQYEPVCCDGETYSNACVASLSCKTDCTEGECDTDGESFEFKPEECGSRTFICTQDYVPVCCNGKTYSNQCVANNDCATDCVEGEC